MAFYFCGHYLQRRELLISGGSKRVLGVEMRKKYRGEGKFNDDKAINWNVVEKMNRSEDELIRNRSERDCLDSTLQGL